ncbi:MAG: hypothetical protein LBI33_06555, partial [Propionibacteriaceae bacterium]|nr:hypothetical protein [Propionibacteriaceae bacterium]
MKKTLVPWLIIAVALGGCAVSPESSPSATTAPAPEVVIMNASYPSFATADDLASRSTDVLVGRVTMSTVRQIDITDYTRSDDPRVDPGGMPTPTYVTHTLHDVVVTRTVKGGATPGATIAVAELGGVLGATDYQTGEGILLADGHTYLLFLQQGSDGRYYLVNPVEAVYQIDDQGTHKDRRNPLDVASV